MPVGEQGPGSIENAAKSMSKDDQSPTSGIMRVREIGQKNCPEEKKRHSGEAVRASLLRKRLIRGLNRKNERDKHVSEGALAKICQGADLRLLLP